MRISHLALAALVCMSVAHSAEAGLLGCLKPSGCGEAVASGYCTAPCPACTPKVEKVKVTRTCYKPKRVPVCIPPIKFPWMKCNEFGCPKIRCVNRFEKEEIDCGEKCVIVWELDEELAKGYCKCQTGGCLGHGCSGCASCLTSCTTGPAVSGGVVTGCTTGSCAPVRPPVVLARPATATSTAGLPRAGYIVTP